MSLFSQSLFTYKFLALFWFKPPSQTCESYSVLPRFSLFTHVSVWVTSGVWDGNVDGSWWECYHVPFPHKKITRITKELLYWSDTLIALVLFSFIQRGVALSTVKLKWLHLTFFLRCGSFLVPSFLVSRATVSLFLQDVADEDAQQAHYAEHGHQSKHCVLCSLFLGGAYDCTVHRCSCTPGRTFTHSANLPLQRCWEGKERVNGWEEAMWNAWCGTGSNTVLTSFAGTWSGSFCHSSRMKPTNGKIKKRQSETCTKAQTTQNIGWISFTPSSTPVS